MSWGLRNRASIYLSRHHVRLRIWRAGLLRDAMIDECVIPSETLERALADSLSHIAEIGGAGSRVTIFLGASESILDVITAVPGLRGEKDWQALAQQRLLLDSGIDPEQWRVRYTLLPGARQAFAAAVPVWLCKSCQDFSKSNGLSITAIHIFALRCLGYAVARPRNFAFRLMEPGTITRFVYNDAWSIMATPNTSPDLPVDARGSLNIQGEREHLGEIAAELRYTNPLTPSAEMESIRHDDYADLLAWTTQ